MSRRHERQAQGSEESSLNYGSMGGFKRALREALLKKGLDLKARDWGHQGKNNTRRKP